MSKQLIAVLMGGPSREHEISLKSGQAMVAGLNPEKYDVLPVTITKSGVWQWNNESALTCTEALQKLHDEQAIVLIGLHGSFGEDGTVQALLERYEVPYTGSGVAASLLAMNKSVAHDMYNDAGLTVPQSQTYNIADRPTAATVLEAFSLPLVIKPAQQGSSVGVHIVKEASNIEDALNDAYLYDSDVIAQQFIAGRELSCGVIEKDGELVALPPTEIKPKVSEFFDYKAKYTDGGSEELTPAPLTQEQTAMVQSIAQKAHYALGCSGYSRTDVILDCDDQMFVIETNTLPGMTEFSILPAQAAAAGMSFSDLLDQILANAQR